MIEKGQIYRRFNFGIMQVVEIRLCDIICEKSDKRQFKFNIEGFLATSELVTLDNIKEGEWVKCIETCQSSNGKFYNKGFKYELRFLDGSATAKQGDNPDRWRYVRLYEKLFKPCLPPIQEKPPIGIEPYDIFMEKHQEELSNLAKKSQEKRKNELVLAIERYLSKGLTIPIEWVEEYNKWVG